MLFFGRPKQERSELLKTWIEANENLNACETQLLLTKSQETEVAKEKELLTIKDMVDRGFSQNLACLFIHRFCFDSHPKLSTVEKDLQSNKLRIFFLTPEGRRSTASSRRTSRSTTKIVLTAQKVCDFGASQPVDALTGNEWRSLGRHPSM